jgi:hypothetical protein
MAFFGVKARERIKRDMHKKKETAKIMDISIGLAGSWSNQEQDLLSCPARKIELTIDPNSQPHESNGGNFFFLAKLD